MKRLIFVLVIITFSFSTTLPIGARPILLSRPGADDATSNSNTGDNDPSKTDSNSNESHSRDSESNSDDEGLGALSLTTTVTLVLAAIGAGIATAKIITSLVENSKAVKEDVIELEDQIYEGEGAELEELSVFFGIPKAEICRIYDQLVLDGMNSDTQENAAELFIALIDRLILT